MSLETYARERASFRAKVLEHKKNRTVQLGEHVTLQFEDELTVRYQVQEMLRIERIFEDEGIQGELDVYNPLIEYPDPDERRQMLGKLKGIERRVWVQIDDCERVFAIADEDLERETEEKTSSVHFLRFELSAAMREHLRRGARVVVGVDHPQYRASAELQPAVRAALAADLN